jgi:hypothetical protein
MKKGDPLLLAYYFCDTVRPVPFIILQYYNECITLYITTSLES